VSRLYHLSALGICASSVFVSTELKTALPAVKRGGEGHDDSVGPGE
jgi:hypothetical protein